MNRQDVTLIQVVRCFERSVAFMREQVADLSDEDLLLQPAGAPNHGAWTIGHVIHSCHEIARILGALAWLPDDWEARFGYGSSPHELSPSSDVSKVVLLGSLSEAGERLCDALQRAGGDQLGAALPGEGGGTAFATVGDAVVQIVCAHTAFHAGQLAAWRRAIGRKPVGVFV